MSRILTASFLAFTAGIAAAADIQTTESSLSIVTAGVPHGHMVLQHARTPASRRPGDFALYPEVYPGIGVRYYKRADRDARFEYDFIVSPGADPSRIRLAFPSANAIRVDEAGDLIVHSAIGTIRHRRPYSYQLRDGREIEVASTFRLSGRTVTFDLGEYDRRATLVIDPEVVYSTPVTACCFQAIGPDGSAYYVTWFAIGLVGGPVFQKLNPAGQSQYTLPLNSVQQFAGVAVDSAGAFYANGSVDGTNPPPLVNAVRTTPASSFLAKVRPDGTGFVFITYYEGARGAMTVAPDGSIFVAGGGSITKIASTGAVLWTHTPNFGGASITFRSVAVEGTSVFAGGHAGQGAAALAKASSGTDPGASTFAKTWTTQDLLGPRVLVEPDGAGGSYLGWTEFVPACNASSVKLLRVDSAGNQTASTAVPFAPPDCSNPSNQFDDEANASAGVYSLTRAANGDLWVAGLEEYFGVFRTFVRLFAPTLPAPSVSAASSLPREPLISNRAVLAMRVDAAGNIFSVSRGLPGDGFVARKTMMTTASPIGQPTGITAVQSVSTPNAIAVSWPAVTGATGYQVYAAPYPFGPFSGSQNVAGGATTSAVIPVTQTTATASYWVSVRACLNAFGDTTCGESARTVTTVNLTPEILSPATGATLTNSTVTFSWANIAAFSRQRLTVFRNGQQVLADTYNSPTNQAYYSLPSGNYTMRLAGALSGNWIEVTRNFTIQLPAVPASTPAIQSATVSGGNSVTVNFPTVTGADLYLIQVIQPNTGPGGGALTVAARFASASPVTMSIPSGPASVVVSACNGDGCAPHSGPVAINPAGPNPAAPVLASPAAGSFVTGPVVFFSWSRIPGDNGSNTTYRLYIQDMERQYPAGNVYTTQNFWAIRLQPGKRYDALVLVTANGQNLVSGVSNFLVSGPTLQSPTPVIPGYQETNAPRHISGGLELSWAPVPGAQYHQFILYPADGSSPFSSNFEGSGRVFFGIRPGSYYGKVRACLLAAPAVCPPDSDTGWGPWSDTGGTGAWSFSFQ